MRYSMSLRKEEDNLFVDFNDLEDWESFEVIARRIIDITGVNPREKIDGPDSRVWFFNCKGDEIVLVNNPYGNYLKASSSGAKQLLHKIVEHF